MGEYARRRGSGERVKIGTCEDLYYLRADQARDVVALEGNVDPVADARDGIRFRFPWPWEDGTAPGEFTDYAHAVALADVRAPAEVDHGRTQFKAEGGYLLSVPCPEAMPAELLARVDLHRNGYAGPIELVQHRLVGEHLCAVARCRGCGARWRYPDLPSVLPLVESFRKRGERDGSPAMVRVARRIVDGYSGRHPFAPGWVSGWWSSAGEEVARRDDRGRGLLD